MKQLVVGTRGSKLAMAQTKTIIDQLDCSVEIQKITTRGDKITDVALAKIEGKGFFTKEIDEALLRGDIDFAVHSFKDVPTDLPEGITIAAIPVRESPKDAIMGQYSSFDELPQNAKVGTSSIRRRAMALKTRPDISIQDLRGNLDTRIKKLSDGLYDAIIVAEAGLNRLGYTGHHPLDPDMFIPAAGQGAIAITATEDNKEVIDELIKLDNRSTRLICEAEREFLLTLEGGCQVPAGIYTNMNNVKEEIELTGFISSLDGKFFIRDSSSGAITKAKAMANDLANGLLSAGGKEILNQIRTGGP
jgi:hydroxymethylbilane synthase